MIHSLCPAIDEGATDDRQGLLGTMASMLCAEACPERHNVTIHTSSLAHKEHLGEFTFKNELPN